MAGNMIGGLLGVIGQRRRKPILKYLRFFNDSGNSYVDFGDKETNIGYPDTGDSFSFVLDVLPLDSVTGYVMSTGGHTSSIGVAIVKTTDANFRFFIKSGNVLDDGQEAYDFTNTNIVIGEWNHIECEWVKGSYASITVNGVKVTNTTPTSGFNSNNQKKLILGVPNNNIGVVNFNGYMKNFKVWNDIAKTDVWGDWPMLEGSGCEVIDNSGVNTNGILMPDCPTTSPIWEKITL